jgi:hypothetical protein
MDQIDITITGGVLGITERRSTTMTALDPDTCRALTEALARSDAPVPVPDDPMRDGRFVTIARGRRSTTFPEHQAPPFWDRLKRSTSMRGG